MSERVVVTGAAGFVGSRLVGALLAAGVPVTGVDNFDPYYSRAVKERALHPLLGSPQLRFAEADVRDRVRMGALLRGADAVVHLAARPGVRASFATPDETRSLNVEGTVAVLGAAQAAGCRRIVVASSSSVYGHAAGRPEEAVLLRPLSPYAESKRAAELACLTHAESVEARLAVLRLFTVYGPGQRPDQAIARFTERLSRGDVVEQHGDGTSERDYTYVDDAVTGILQALSWTRGAAPALEIFNIGSGRSVPLHRVIHALAARLGVPPRVVALPAPPGDAHRTRAELSKARAVLDYHPRFGFDEGIARYVSWYEDTHERQRRATA